MSTIESDAISNSNYSESKEETLMIHPAKFLDSNPDDIFFTELGGFQFKWIFCVRSRKTNAQGWLAYFFKTEIFLAIINILGYGTFITTWFLRKFALIETLPRDLIILILLILVFLVWLIILVLSIRQLCSLKSKNQDKEARKGVIFGTKTVLIVNLLTNFVSITITVLQGMQCYSDIQKNKKMTGNLRFWVAVTFCSLSLLMLGQAYMYWQAQEPLNEYIKPIQEVQFSAALNEDST